MFKEQIVFLLLILCISFSGTFARETHDLEVIAFQSVKKLMLIEAKVDSITGNFIFDTGAKGLLLNDTYFKGAVPKPSLSSMSGHTVETSGKFVDFQLGALPASQVEAMILNLNSAEAYTGMKIHGLIGLRLFRNHELLIDYVNEELRIYELDKKGEKLVRNEPPELYDEERSLDRKYHLPAFRARINGKKIRLALDTGASSHVISELIAKRHASSFSAPERKVLAGLGNQTKAARSAVAEGIQVGSILFDPMETLIEDFVPINRKLDGVPIDGILGCPFLVQFRVALNFRKGKMYLWENDSDEKLRYFTEGRDRN